MLLDKGIPLVECLRRHALLPELASPGKLRFYVFKVAEYEHLVVKVIEHAANIGELVYWKGI